MSTEEGSMVGGLNKAERRLSGYSGETSLTQDSEYPHLFQVKTEIIIPFSMLDGYAKLTRDKLLTGEELANRIVLANQCAARNEFRAITSNKGAMNLMVAFLDAQGYSNSLFEAIAHTFAFSNGRYNSFTEYSIIETVANGPCLKGNLSMHLSLADFRRPTTNPFYASIRQATDLSPENIAKKAAQLGLWGNFSGLAALVGRGIVYSHNYKSACGFAHANSEESKI